MGNRSGWAFHVQSLMRALASSENSWMKSSILAWLAGGDWERVVLVVACFIVSLHPFMRTCSVPGGRGGLDALHLACPGLPPHRQAA